MTLRFDNTYARLPDRFFERVTPTKVSAPRLLALADDAYLATFGVTAAELASESGVAMLGGNRVPEGATPIALAYAGHQFGHFVPQLGDGRAILLGEVVGSDGQRRDVQLKGAGRTPFSRNGDGRAAIGPVLRELVVSEAMAALGVPTTRALGAVLTGETVYRGPHLPGAVLARVAASHLRIGTFEYFAARGDVEALAILVDYALARHYAAAPRPDGPALALFDAVASAQIALVARWLALGFVHGVMNTDNVAISGETLDYGPCAFLDTYDPSRTFSSIDERGRYAFANQPRVLVWNLSCLAQALVPLVADGDQAAIALLNERLESMSARIREAHAHELRRKLGLLTVRDDDEALAHDLLSRMAAGRVDYTSCFRRLGDVAAGGDPSHVAQLFAEPEAFIAWHGRWRQRLTLETATADERVAIMRRTNPAFIPRNHRVEEMIAAAIDGDLRPLERLRAVLRRPYDEQPEAADLQQPPGDEQWHYRTFCGT